MQNFFGDFQLISMKRHSPPALFLLIIGALQICMEPIAGVDSGSKTPEMNVINEKSPALASAFAHRIDSHLHGSGDSAAKPKRHL
jgi:hypothetical protein